MDIKAWISPKFHDPKVFAKLYASAKPYPHISLKGFLREEIARKLQQALKAQQFTAKESDLFKISQTYDLTNNKDPVLGPFFEFVASKEFAIYMQQITGLKLSPKGPDMAGFKYDDTGYLLCHDDRVTGRKIAYIFYLSEDFKKEDGGCLALFTSKKNRPDKLVKRYSPTWNTLNFFTVSPVSWHSVEEVTGPKPRLSLGGWFR